MFPWRVGPRFAPLVALWTAAAALLSSPISTWGQSLPSLRDAEGEVTLLPDVLTEISGLAWSTAGTLLAHDDERAIVYRIDPESGEILQRFWPGGFPLRGDFEGIAVHRGRVYLTDSEGTLVVFEEDGSTERRAHRIVRTGLGERCEIEGLAFDAISNSLLLPCKSSYEEENAVVLFAYDLDESSDSAHGPGRVRTFLTIDREALETMDLGRDFRPSAVEVHPDSDHLFLLAGPESALIEVDREGVVIAGVDLRKRNHPQPEGLAWAPDGTIFIADEGDGGRARLTRYVRSISQNR